MITLILLFSSSGLDYVVTKGSEYDFWQEGVYNSHEDIHRCFAFKAYSKNYVKMAQGFGSDCNGMSSELNFDSAFRFTLSSSSWFI